MENDLSIYAKQDSQNFDKIVKIKNLLGAFTNLIRKNLIRALSIFTLLIFLFATFNAKAQLAATSELTVRIDGSTVYSGGAASPSVSISSGSILSFNLSWTLTDPRYIIQENDEIVFPILSMDNPEYLQILPPTNVPLKISNVEVAIGYFEWAGNTLRYRIRFNSAAKNYIVGGGTASGSAEFKYTQVLVPFPISFEGGMVGKITIADPKEPDEPGEPGEPGPAGEWHPLPPERDQPDIFKALVSDEELWDTYDRYLSSSKKVAVPAMNNDLYHGFTWAVPFYGLKAHFEKQPDRKPTDYVIAEDIISANMKFAGFEKNSICNAKRDELFFWSAMDGGLSGPENFFSIGFDQTSFDVDWGMWGAGMALIKDDGTTTDPWVKTASLCMYQNQFDEIEDGDKETLVRSTPLTYAVIDLPDGRQKLIVNLGKFGMNVPEGEGMKANQMIRDYDKDAWLEGIERFLHFQENANPYDYLISKIEKLEELLEQSELDADEMEAFQIFHGNPSYIIKERYNAVNTDYNESPKQVFDRLKADVLAAMDAGDPLEYEMWWGETFPFYFCSNPGIINYADLGKVQGDYTVLNHFINTWIANTSPPGATWPYSNHPAKLLAMGIDRMMAEYYDRWELYNQGAFETAINGILKGLLFHYPNAVDFFNDICGLNISRSAPFEQKIAEIRAAFYPGSPNFDIVRSMYLRNVHNKLLHKHIDLNYTENSHVHHPAGETFLGVNGKSLRYYFPDENVRPYLFNETISLERLAGDGVYALCNELEDENGWKIDNGYLKTYSNMPLTYTFEGTGFEIWGQIQGANMLISVNGTSEQQVWIQHKPGDHRMYSIYNLPMGTHTITMRGEGGYNTDSWNEIFIKNFEIQKAITPGDYNSNINTAICPDNTSVSAVYLYYRTVLIDETVTDFSNEVKISTAGYKWEDIVNYQHLFDASIWGYLPDQLGLKKADGYVNSFRETIGLEELAADADYPECEGELCQQDGWKIDFGYLKTFSNMPLSYTFEGVGFELWGRIKSTELFISIDGAPEQTLTLGDKLEDSLLFSVTDLPRGTHTITIRVEGGYDDFAGTWREIFIKEFVIHEIAERWRYGLSEIDFSLITSGIASTEFEIYYLPTELVEFEYLGETDGVPEYRAGTGTLTKVTTGRNGTLKLINLRDDVYLKEIGVDGYYTGSQSKTIDVSAGNNIAMYDIPSGVALRKFNENETVPLNGAGFEIYKEAGTDNWVRYNGLPTSMTDGTGGFTKRTVGLGDEARTGYWYSPYGTISEVFSDFRASGIAPNIANAGYIYVFGLPDGNYKFVETTAPAGYLLPIPAPEVLFTINTTGAAPDGVETLSDAINYYALVGNLYTLTNGKKPAPEIKVLKVGVPENDLSASGIPMSDIGFKLVKTSNFNNDWESVPEKLTSSDGYVIWSGADIVALAGLDGFDGTYMLVESTPPNGITPIDPIMFSINTDGEVTNVQLGLNDLQLVSFNNLTSSVEFKVKNTIDPSVVLIKGNKTITGVNVENQTFTFELTQIVGLGNLTPVSPPDVQVQTATVPTYGAGDYAFSFTITDLADGTYYFLITETDGGVAGWKYDDSEYIVEVVMDNGVAVISNYNIEFTNHYSVADFEFFIKKAVMHYGISSIEDYTKSFTFHVREVTDEAALTYKQDGYENSVIVSPPWVLHPASYPGAEYSVNVSEVIKIEGLTDGTYYYKVWEDLTDINMDGWIFTPFDWIIRVVVESGIIADGAIDKAILFGSESVNWGKWDVDDEYYDFIGYVHINNEYEQEKFGFEFVKCETNTTNVFSGQPSKPVPGAEFTLYSDITIQSGTITVNESTEIKSAVSDANGIVKFDGLESGTYYMKETIIPPGYSSIDLPIYKIEIATGGTYIITVNTYGTTFYDYTIFGAVLTVNELTGGVNESGKDFGIYSDEACTERFSMIKSGTDGKLLIGGESMGVNQYVTTKIITYYIKADEGDQGIYKFDMKAQYGSPVKYEYDVTKLGSPDVKFISDAMMTYAVLNDPVNVSFGKIEKDLYYTNIRFYRNLLIANGWPNLTNVNVGLYQSLADAETGVNPQIATMFPGDNFGFCVFTELLADKTYYLKEVTPPTMNGGTTAPPDNTIYSLTLVKIPGGFDIQYKYLSGDSWITFNIGDIPFYFYGIPGTQFALYDTKTDAQAGTPVISTAISNENGTIRFSHVEIDKNYYVKEIMPASGYKLNETIYRLRRIIGEDVYGDLEIQTVIEYETSLNVWEEVRYGRFTGSGIKNWIENFLIENEKEKTGFDFHIIKQVETEEDFGTSPDLDKTFNFYVYEIDEPDYGVALDPEVLAQGGTLLKTLSNKGEWYLLGSDTKNYYEDPTNSFEVEGMVLGETRWYLVYEDQTGDGIDGWTYGKQFYILKAEAIMEFSEFIVALKACPVYNIGDMIADEHSYTLKMDMEGGFIKFFNEYKYIGGTPLYDTIRVTTCEKITMIDVMQNIESSQCPTPDVSFITTSKLGATLAYDPTNGIVYTKNNLGLDTIEYILHCDQSVLGTLYVTVNSMTGITIEKTNLTNYCEGEADINLTDNVVVSPAAPQSTVTYYHTEISDGNIISAPDSWTLPEGTTLITIIVSAVADGCDSIATFTITPKNCDCPAINLATKDTTICGIEEISIPNNSFVNTTSVSLTHDGEGELLPLNTTTSPFTIQYIPDSKDAGKIITITVTTANSENPLCSPVSDTIKISIPRIPFATPKRNCTD